ncbi:unnamed protein product [Owenia fusiformis]|uniref:Uncharacterized protein n=1 Tax=Owenia fusiformis TaxID=6347 RepID=A0A8J1TXM0_OWEFU|nr:unnamed protein product [Owenia fusiformis]
MATPLSPESNQTPSNMQLGQNMTNYKPTISHIDVAHVHGNRTMQSYSSQAHTVPLPNTGQQIIGPYQISHTGPLHSSSMSNSSTSTPIARPPFSGKTEREAERHIHNNMPAFVDRINPKQYLPYLPCLTKTDKEQITAEQSNNGERLATMTLLNCVMKHENWQSQLQKALEANGQTSLAKQIEPGTDSVDFSLTPRGPPSMDTSNSFTDLQPRGPPSASTSHSLSNGVMPQSLNQSEALLQGPPQTGAMPQGFPQNGPMLQGPHQYGDIPQALKQNGTVPQGSPLGGAMFQGPTQTGAIPREVPTQAMSLQGPPQSDFNSQSGAIPKAPPQSDINSQSGAIPKAPPESGNMSSPIPSQDSQQIKAMLKEPLQDKTTPQVPQFSSSINSDSSKSSDNTSPSDMSIDNSSSSDNISSSNSSSENISSSSSSFSSSDQSSPTKSKVLIPESIEDVVRGKTYPIYEDELPADLQESFFDGVIIYCAADRSKAEELKRIMQDKVPLERGGKPKICLFQFCAESENRGSDDILFQPSIFSSLATAILHSTYMFILFTEEFNQGERWTELIRDECLMESIVDPDRRWCVVPLYYVKSEVTLSTQTFGIRTLRGVMMTESDCMDWVPSKISKMLQYKRGVRRQREQDLKDRIDIWVQEEVTRRAIADLEKEREKKRKKEESKMRMQRALEHEQNKDDEFNENLKQKKFEPLEDNTPSVPHHAPSVQPKVSTTAGVTHNQDAMVKMMEFFTKMQQGQLEQNQNVILEQMKAMMELAKAPNQVINIERTDRTQIGDAQAIVQAPSSTKEVSKGNQKDMLGDDAPYVLEEDATNEPERENQPNEPSKDQCPDAVKSGSNTKQEDSGRKILEGSFMSSNPAKDDLQGAVSRRSPSAGTLNTMATRVVQSQTSSGVGENVQLKMDPIPSVRVPSEHPSSEPVESSASQELGGASPRASSPSIGSPQPDLTLQTIPSTRSTRSALNITGQPSEDSNTVSGDEDNKAMHPSITSNREPVEGTDLLPELNEAAQNTEPLYYDSSARDTTKHHTGNQGNQHIESTGDVDPDRTIPKQYMDINPSGVSDQLKKDVPTTLGGTDSHVKKDCSNVQKNEEKSSIDGCSNVALVGSAGLEVTGGEEASMCPSTSGLTTDEKLDRGKIVADDLSSEPPSDISATNSQLNKKEAQNLSLKSFATTSIKSDVDSVDGAIPDELLPRSMQYQVPETSDNLEISRPNIQAQQVKHNQSSVESPAASASLALPITVENFPESLTDDLNNVPLAKGVSTQQNRIQSIETCVSADPLGAVQPIKDESTIQDNEEIADSVEINPRPDESLLSKPSILCSKEEGQDGVVVSVSASGNGDPHISSNFNEAPLDSNASLSLCISDASSALSNPSSSLHTTGSKSVSVRANSANVSGSTDNPPQPLSSFGEIPLDSNINFYISNMSNVTNTSEPPPGYTSVGDDVIPPNQDQQVQSQSTFYISCEQEGFALVDRPLEDAIEATEESLNSEQIDNTITSMDEITHAGANRDFSDTQSQESDDKPKSGIKKLFNIFRSKTAPSGLSSGLNSSIFKTMRKSSKSSLNSLEDKGNKN